jgi:hypothetical protein
LPVAEFFLLGLPLGLANAPSSLARSWRMGWTRMTWPSLDSWTDPATMVPSMEACAQRRPAGWVGLAGEGDHPGVVRQPGHRQPGSGIPCAACQAGPRCPVRLVLAQPLGVGGDHHPGVHDVHFHQPARHYDLDGLAGVGRADRMGEPGQSAQQSGATQGR